MTHRQQFVRIMQEEYPGDTCIWEEGRFNSLPARYRQIEGLGTVEVTSGEELEAAHELEKAMSALNRTPSYVERFFRGEEKF